MSILNIPGMDGIKTAVAGYGLILLGLADFLSNLSGFVLLLGQCLLGQADLSLCVQQLPQMGAGLVVALAGLLGIGLGHKIEKKIVTRPPLPAPSAPDMD